MVIFPRLPARRAVLLASRFGIVLIFTCSTLASAAPAGQVVPSHDPDDLSDLVPLVENPPKPTEPPAGTSPAPEAEAEDEAQAESAPPDAEASDAGTAPEPATPASAPPSLDHGGMSDFMDVWVTFTVADDNLRRNDSFSPAPQINDTRPESDGRSDLTDTHLVLYKALAGYLPRVVTEAGVVLRFSVQQDALGGTSVGLKDDGSFVGLRVNVGADPDDGDSALDLTGFPFNAERFLLGHAYDLTWGGKASWPQNTKPVPGLRLSLRLARDHYLFVGMKTHPQPERDELDSESGASSGSIRTTYAGLFGVGTALSFGGSKLGLDAGAGVMQKGDNPQINELDLAAAGKSSRADDILAIAASGRLWYAWRGEVGDPLDLKLYRQDPRNLFVRPSQDAYPGGFSAQMDFEATWMRENLRQFAESRVATGWFDGLGMQAQLRLRYETFRIFFTYLHRNLEFLLFDGPHGDPPFFVIPRTSRSAFTNAQGEPEMRDVAKIDTTPEQRLRVSADYKIKPAWLTLGIGFEYQIPATKTLTPIEYDAAGTRIVRRDAKVVTVYKERETSSTSTFLTRQVRAVLPPTFEKNDILTFTFTSKFDLSDILSAMLEIGYRRDFNMVKFARDANGDLVKLEEESDVTNALSLGLTLQARF